MRYLLFLTLLFLTFPASAGSITEDQHAARILVYYGIGHDNSPATSVTLSQFKAHLNELAVGDYNVIALPDMLNAYKRNAPLPHNAIVLTFDGSEKSVLTHAAPLLKKLKYPFTVFLSPERVRDTNPRYLNNKDIKRLRKLQLVTFGIHPEGYNDERAQDIKTIRMNLNNAVSFYRDIFNKQPEYLSFSNGLYSPEQLHSVSKYKFKALFGEQSGVTYRNKLGSILPRFTMTENYADQNRFKMVVNALPFPADDISPASSIIENNAPSLGLTTSGRLNLEKLSCYASDQPKPSVSKLNNRIEIRLQQEINEPRFRVNCTLPEKNAETEEVKWRWFGLLLNVAH